jgi:hypothetical protein
VLGHLWSFSVFFFFFVEEEVAESAETSLSSSSLDRFRSVWVEEGVSLVRGEGEEEDDDVGA